MHHDLASLVLTEIFDRERPSPMSQENQTGQGSSSTAFLCHQMRPQTLLLPSLPFSGRRAQSPAAPKFPSLILLPQPPSREVPTHSCGAPPSAGTSSACRRGWQRRCPTSPSWCSHQSPLHPAGKGHWATQPGSLWRAGELLHQACAPTPSQAAVPTWQDPGVESVG